MAKRKSKMNTRILVCAAVMVAVSVVLSYFEVTPPLSPAFVKLDVSDFPALLATFAFSPLAGVMRRADKKLD